MLTSVPSIRNTCHREPNKIFDDPQRTHMPREAIVDVTTNSTLSTSDQDEQVYMLVSNSHLPAPSSLSSLSLSFSLPSTSLFYSRANMCDR
jgi:hypothetical protein